MGKKRVKFTFNGEMIKEPVIYKLGRNFEIMTNIRRADVGDELAPLEVRILEHINDARQEAGLAPIAG